jgi:hypothetical protein
MRHPILAGLALGTLVLCAAPAPAATVTRNVLRMATLGCQSALPTFDTSIRKRPLAVQNEGTADAYVTCGLQGTFLAAPLSTSVAVKLRNNTAASVAVSCTLTDAGAGLSNPIYFTKTVTLAANAVDVDLGFSSADNGGTAFIYPAFSCALPPGTGISATTQSYPEDVGN